MSTPRRTEVAMLGARGSVALFRFLLQMVCLRRCYYILLQQVVLAKLTRFVIQPERCPRCFQRCS
jgi:hypothetical protein